jgi:hypothetical protein
MQPETMPNFLTTVTEYIAEREALFVRVDMSGYLIDYYLHRKDVAAGISAEQDEHLKDLIACLAVHLTIHPSAEAHAWTLHLIAEPPYSVFATGSLIAPGSAVASGSESNGADGYIVGNVLTENIRHTDVNSLHAQFTDSKGNSFKSYVQSENPDIAAVIEHFYEQSEQQPLRIEISRNSDTAVALAALPGYDSEWFRSVSLEQLANDSTPLRKSMRRCSFAFFCDCSPQKLLPFFRSLSKENLDELYGDDEQVTIVCPRCGRQFILARSDLRPETKPE